MNKDAPAKALYCGGFILSEGRARRISSQLNQPLRGTDGWYTGSDHEFCEVSQQLVTLSYS